MSRHVTVVLLALSLAGIGAPAVAQEADRGRTVFEQRCGFCHGAERQQLAARVDERAAFTSIVRRGRGENMPPFSEIALSEEDLCALHGYLRALKTDADAP